MLGFGIERQVRQIVQFDLLEDKEVKKYNKFCARPDITIIKEETKDVKGYPGNEMEPGEPSRLIRIVQYLIKESQIDKSERSKK